MSFYGNVKNTTRTQFHFDRIYPNRHSMDSNAKKDNIFAGRYVLVEYEQDISADDFEQYYYYGQQMYTEVVKQPVKMVLDPSIEIEAIEGGVADAIVNQNTIEGGTICCIPAGQHVYLRLGTPMYIQILDSSGSYKVVNKSEYDGFYKSHSDMVDPQIYIINDKMYYVNNFIGGQYAVIEPHRNYNTSADIQYWRAKVTTIKDNEGNDVSTTTWETVSEGESIFVRNFNIDKGSYAKEKRTYDSTVWQKVYVGNEEKYIMVADLNTITPTFTFTADAPTVTPVPPHYDPNNTNTNYNIHLQGPWGLRVKGANGNLTIPSIDHAGRISDKLPSVNASIYHETYPSDFVTQWKGSFYDIIGEGEYEKYYSPYSGKWNGKYGNASSGVESAIYVNKNGFNPKRISKSQDIKDKNSGNYNPFITARIEDRISLEPTGRSGRIYNDHLSNEGYQAQADTQELVFMLPSIGDAISDIWDIVYGGRDTNTIIKNTDYRNLDINWEYANGVVERQGLRAVLDDNGHFNDKNLNTIAGCINTVHDMLGMIVVEKSDSLDISKYEDGYIYQFNDGSYRRKVTKYSYTKELTYTYSSVSLNELTYAPGHYYTKSGSDYIVCDDAEFSPSKTYYAKKITIPSKYTKVENLGEIPKGTKLYYKTPVDPETGKPNYRVVFDVAEDVNYYTLNKATPQKVTAVYNPYEFYYYKSEKEELTDGTEITISGFHIDTAEKGTEGRAYFRLDNSSIQNAVNQSLEDTGRYDTESGKYVLDYDEEGKPLLTVDLAYIYCPKFFYRMTTETRDDGSEVKTIKLEERPYNEIDIDDDYYIINGSKVSGDNEGQWVQNPDGSFTTSDETVNLQVTGMYKVKLLPWKENHYYYASPKQILPSFSEGLEYDDEEDKVEDDTIVEEENTLLPTFVGSYKYLTLEKLTEFYNKEFTFDGGQTSVFTKFYIAKFIDAGKFYQSKVFYFQTPDGSYAIDKNEEMTEGRQYFADVTFNLFEGIEFYVPNKYYTIDPTTGEYILEKSLTYDSTKDHYRLTKGIYVMSDSLGLFAPHSEWPNSVTQVPASVRLCYRDETVGTENLVNFGRGLNTIHGLILQLNKMLDIDNFDTRNRTTLQGCINTVNDIINRFHELIPNNFAIIDDYGRINNAHWDTLQKDSCSKVKATTASVKELAEGSGQDIYQTASSVANMRNQWITLEMDSAPNSPLFKIHHNYQPVTNTTTDSNKNGGTATNAGINHGKGDTLSLYTPIVDKMGHVVGQNTETITLPYGFKTITSNGSIDTAVELSVSSADIVADSTQDTFNFNVGNKWLRTATTASSDTLTIAHTLSPISSQADTKYGLEQDETINLLDRDNTFEVPVFKFDEAGHITFAETHTVTIPEVFENISIAGNSTNTADTTGDDTGTISADALTDTLNLAAGNRWIQMSHNVNTDTITFKHYVKKFTETTGSTDLDNSNTFTVQEIAWDNAGHLTSSKKRTYTLQDGYKQVGVANSGANTTTTVAAAAGTLTAATQVDKFTMDTGNRWIILTADETNKKVTISHAAPGTASISKGDTSAQTPNFGAKFKVLSAGIDQTGHVKSLEEHEVTIPSLAIGDKSGTSGNVMTNVTLSTNGQKFEITRANVGTLALTGYVTPTENAVQTLEASDTINGAFSKVQSYLGSLTDTIGGLELTDSSVNGEFVNSVSQENGKITVSRTAFVPSISITAGTNSAAPKVNVTVNGKSGTAQSLTVATTAKYGVTKLSDAIDSDVSTTAATSKAVKTAYDLANDAIAQTAKFECDVTKVDTYETDLDEVTDAQYTIEQLSKKIAILEAHIAALEA